MITLKELSFSYSRKKEVLDRINLEVGSGHICGLLGKNGEGKTTLLNLLSGQIFPDQGSCLVLEEIPAERNARFLQQIFLLPEEISMPEVTAIEYIKMYAPFYPTFRDDICKACVESFEINLSDRLSKMSQGQRKKVAITLALAAHTPLLLMDEPTNGLDIPSKATFRRLVASLIDDNQTVIISTHQVRDLESLIDTVLILDQRQILLNKTLNEIGEKLYFGPLLPEEKALYSEPTPQGTIGVTAREDKEETAVSLELLFNAAITYPKEIQRIMNS
ncbi:ATP-binding cassette domain-containing protein [Parabacteroides distasonis]|uniref:ABC transporter ATP-binding protein n=1 Tax=Parabacteroides distasonis TaxID=823 RepID=UPI000E894BC9|nr:ABC transporter ATP-binding protein [Parabacteroides distasonis]MDB9189318.1 ABC transporter ATP-binding protein [Parabacteroides distasonis]MDB9198626.1 ABC transporter ATP-binding protein [Parabacteroides distasonis]HBN44277.1 ABC transporter ATP-binding protein [Parabacteroides distasonis]